MISPPSSLLGHTAVFGNKDPEINHAYVRTGEDSPNIPV